MDISKNTEVQDQRNHVDNIEVVSINIMEDNSVSETSNAFLPVNMSELNSGNEPNKNEMKVSSFSNKINEPECSIRISIEYEGKDEIIDEALQKGNGIIGHNVIMESHEEKQHLNGAGEVDRQLPKKRKVNVFTNESLPQWYHVRGALVTPPVLPRSLPKAFEGLPIYGKPKSKDGLEKFNSEKLREFIGCDLDDEEFDELSKYCSPDHLKTGNELISKTNIPTPGIFPVMDTPTLNSDVNLNILKKCKLRNDRDPCNRYNTRLKYRAVRLIPTSQGDGNVLQHGRLLEPGKDILYHLRLYRPYSSCLQQERSTRGRHSVFSFDIMLSGWQYLSAIRDRIVCNNDLDMRVDVSNSPDTLPVTTSKDVFPSGFLFINNVFYVDTRDGCNDISQVIRDWAVKRGMGTYAKKDMCKVRLDDITVKLGYPEVYIHQGNCEHVFTFSEIRLVSARDPLCLSQYPYVPSVSQNQTIYCTTCAEYGAKWVAVGCSSVPFDPAFFCDTCFRQYMYKDGRKIGDFKAYSYRGNEINMLKPQG